MIRHIRDSVAYYKFESLQGLPNLVHGISTRHGGTSPTPFHSLNLSKFVGDNPGHVDSNLSVLHSALGLDPKRTVSARQARADHVVLVTESHAGSIIADADALLTNEPQIPLLLKYADCVPVMLFDPINRAAGVVHAGWSGTVMRIVTKAIRTMVESYGTKPGDLIAGIGPSIGPCCYCIGPDVTGRVREAFAYSEKLLCQRDGQVFFDLWDANAAQMRELGVSNIETASLCTSHHKADFFSARAEKPVTGRFGGIIALR